MAPGFSPLKLCHTKEKRVSPGLQNTLFLFPRKKTKLEILSVRNSENLCVSETQKFWLVFPLANCDLSHKIPCRSPWLNQMWFFPLVQI